VEQNYRLYGTNNYTLGTKKERLRNKTIDYVEQNYRLYGTNNYTLGTKKKDRGTKL
jgi:hypothetical protein